MEPQNIRLDISGILMLKLLRVTDVGRFLESCKNYCICFSELLPLNLLTDIVVVVFVAVVGVGL